MSNSTRLDADLIITQEDTRLRCSGRVFPQGTPRHIAMDALRECKSYADRRSREQKYPRWLCDRGGKAG